MSFAWFVVMGYLVGVFLSAIMVGSACVMSGQIADQVARFAAQGLLVPKRFRKSC